MGVYARGCLDTAGHPAAASDRLARGRPSALISRALDELEETKLLPERKVLYQFSARGHEVTQAMLAQLLTGPRDAVATYYRSRPLLLSLGLPLEEALASTMMRAGGVSHGRDIGVIFNMPSRGGVSVLPGCGDVGSQYTPAVGWAQAIRYRATRSTMSYARGCIAVVARRRGIDRHQRLLVGTQHRDHAAPAAAVLHRGQRLTAFRCAADLQTPGGNIAANLSAFRNLQVLDGDGSDPARRRTHCCAMRVGARARARVRCCCGSRCRA